MRAAEAGASGGEKLAGLPTIRGGEEKKKKEVSDTTTAVANADRSTRPSLPPPSGCIRARVPPFRGRGSAAAALRAASHRTPLSFPIPPPITPITPHYLVLCSYAVRSGYAYPSTLLWVDLLHNKVGPCQKNLAAFQKQVDKVIR